MIMQNLKPFGASRSSLILRSIVAIIFGLAAGGIFILFTDTSPLEAYRALFRASFGCQQMNSCAILTTLQFATPLILAGLSAAVAFHAGVFSIGQSGQMVLGAAVTAFLGSRIAFPEPIHPAAALAGAVVIGSVWGIIPGLLKVRLGVNEIIVTLLMNKIAFLMASSFYFGRILPTARLAALAEGTKLNSGIFLALAGLIIVYLVLWRLAAGYEQRMVGQAPLFARYSGMLEAKTVIVAMALSGGLAGLAGGIEVLGVHYRFVTNFSQSDNFDGIIVAIMGQLHPLGILISAIFLGGMRLGAMNGLMLQAGIPRELGGVMIALMLLFLGAHQLYERNILHVQSMSKAALRRLRAKFQPDASR
jgi:general nucleoside transport system permease protein